jgi:hypothetical protein
MIQHCFDPLTNSVFHIDEVSDHALRIQLCIPTLYFHRSVVSVKMRTLAGVVEQTMTITKRKLPRNCEHGRPLYQKRGRRRRMENILISTNIMSLTEYALSR